MASNGKNIRRISSVQEPTKKRGSAWTKAPLPRHHNLERAKALVRRGVYPSLEEAYIAVDNEQEKILIARAREYREKYKRPTAWRNAPLPRKKN